MLGVFAYSCKDIVDDDDPKPKPLFTASQVARGTNDYRTNFAMLSIRTKSAPAGEYRIGAKLASEPAPSGSELRDASATLTRALSANNIEVYLPFHIEGELFDKTNPSYADGIATMLTPDTVYNIYVVKADGSGKVEEVLKVTTDKVPASASVPTDIYGFPVMDITIRTGEPFVVIANDFGYSNYLTFKMTEGGTDTILSDCLPNCTEYSTDLEALFNPTDVVPALLFHKEYPRTATNIVRYDDGNNPMMLKVHVK